MGKVLSDGGFEWESIVRGEAGGLFGSRPGEFCVTAMTKVITTADDLQAPYTTAKDVAMPEHRIIVSTTFLHGPLSGNRLDSMIGTVPGVHFSMRPRWTPGEGRCCRGLKLWAAMGGMVGSGGVVRD